MKNENISYNECIKDKELFFSILIRIVLTIAIIVLMAFVYKSTKDTQINIIDSFKNGEELICESSLVSIANKFKYDKNNQYLITNGVDIFNIKKCTLR